MLNVIVNLEIDRDPPLTPGDSAGDYLGVDFESKLYEFDGSITTSTAFTLKDQKKDGSNALVDYVGLAFDADADPGLGFLAGSAWDLREIRANNNDADTFAAAFADFLADQIVTQIDLQLAVTDPSVGFTYVPDTSTTEENDFLVTFTGTGQPHSFDLLFLSGQAGETAIEAGRLPVTINQGYHYPVFATDPDGDTIRYEFDGPAGMTFDPVGEVIYWDPQTLPAGDYDVTLRAFDDRGGEDEQSWTIELRDRSAQNAAPVLDPIANVTGYQGQTLSFNVTANDADEDPVRFALVDSPFDAADIPDGVSLDAVTGEFVWSDISRSQLDGSPYTFEVVAYDNQGNRSTPQTFTVTLERGEFNQNPTLGDLPDSLSLVGETFELTAQGFDADRDRLHYELAAAPEGMAIHPTNGLTRWTPTEPLTEPFEVEVTVSDGRGGFASTSFLITAVPVNTAPTLVGGVLPTGKTGEVYTTPLDVSDADGDRLRFVLPAETTERGVFVRRVDADGSYELVWGGASVNEPGYTVVSSPAPATGVNGGLPASPNLTVTTYRFDLAVTDDRSAPVVASFELPIGPDEAPNLTFNLNGAKAPQVGTAWASAPIAVGTDLEDDAAGVPLTYAVDSLSASRGVSINASGQLAWTPQDAAPAEITVTVTDSAGNVRRGTLTVPVREAQVAAVNQLPFISSGDPGVAIQGRAWSYTLTAADDDLDSVDITITGPGWALGGSGDTPTVVTGTDAFFLDGVVPTNATGQVVTYDFDIVLDDNNAAGDVVTQTLRLFVGPNSAPAFVEVVESAVGVTGEAIPLAFSFVDFDQDTVRLEIVSPAPGSGYFQDGGSNTVTSLPTVSLDPANPEGFTLLFTPDTPGEQELTVRLRDASDAIAEHTVRLTIADGDDAPPQVQLSVPNFVYAGQTVNRTPERLDTEGDVLTWSLLDGLGRPVTTITDSTWKPDGVVGETPTGLTIDPATGRLSWTPTEAQVSPTDYTFTVQVQDARHVVRLGPAKIGVLERPDLTGTLFNGGAPVFVGGVPLAEVFAGTTVRLPFDVIDFGPDGQTAAPFGETPDDVTFSTQADPALTSVTLTDAAGVALTTSEEVSLDPDDPSRFFVSFDVPAGLAANDYFLQLEAEDGDSNIETYDIVVRVVEPSPPNQLPGLRIEAREVVGDEQTYVAQAVALDPDGLDRAAGQEAYIFQLLYDDGLGGGVQRVDAIPDNATGTNPAGLRIDPASGAITWSPPDGTPTPSDFAYSVVVDVVVNGSNANNAGAAVVRDIPITVQSSFRNTRPIIRPIDFDGAEDDGDSGADGVLRFTAEADDADQDVLTWSLVPTPGRAFPDGVSIDPGTGEFLWLATDAQRNTTQYVTLRVEDPYGAFDERDVVLTYTYTPGNSAPRIVSTLPETQNIESGFRYIFRAVDDEMDAITFEIRGTEQEDNNNEKYAFTKIDSNSAELIWLTPDVGDVFLVDLVAKDARGLESFETVRVTVNQTFTRDPGEDALLPDTAPTINNRIPLVVQKGTELVHTIDAFDPDVDQTGPITYGLHIDFTGTGAFNDQVFALNDVVLGTPFDTNTGELRWDTTDFSLSEFPIRVSAKQNNVTAFYTGNLQIIDPDAGNTPPVLQPKDGLIAAPGERLTTRITAIDAQPDDTITYFLTGPDDFEAFNTNGTTPELLTADGRGFAIAPDGSVSWDVPINLADGDTGTFYVVARDSQGALSEPAAYTVDVREPQDVFANPNPIVGTLNASNPFPRPDERVDFWYVVPPAIDIATATLVLTAGTDSYEIPIFGGAMVPVDFADLDPGPAVRASVVGQAVQAKVVLTDDQGRTAQTNTVTLTPTAPNRYRPGLVIEPYETLIDRPVNFFGRAFDLDGDLRRVVVTATPKNGGTPRVITEYNNLTGDLDRRTGDGNGPLFTLDPLTLPDGAQRITVTAYDRGSQPSSLTLDVNVDSDAKLGNLDLAFTDMVAPVAGFPLTVQRRYDSFDIDSNNVGGDFGPGWSLELLSGQLTVQNAFTTEITNDSFLGTEFGAGLASGTRLDIELPGGRSLGFTAQAIPFSTGNGVVARLSDFFFSIGLGVQAVGFVPDADSRGAKLELENGRSIKLAPELQDYLTVPENTDNINTLIGVWNEDNGQFRGFATGNSSDEFSIPQDPATFGPYKLTDRDGTEYRFDVSSGELLSIQDPYGNALQLGNRGSLIGDDQDDETGRLDIQRDDQGRVVRVTNALGFRVRYTYDPNTGDLRTVRQDIVEPVDSQDDTNNQRVTRFIYDTDYDNTGAFDPAVLDAESFNDSPNTSRAAHFLRRIELRSFNELGEEVWTELSTVNFDNQNRLTGSSRDGQTEQQVTYGEGFTETTTPYTTGPDVVVRTDYDANGNVDKVTIDGQEWTYDHGGPDDEFPDLLKSFTDPAGRTTTYEYDRFGQLDRLIEPGNQVTTYGYNNAGFLTRITDEQTGREERRTYNRQGDLTRLRDETGYVYATWDYDEFGRLLTETDEAGTYTYDYENSKYPTRITTPDGDVILPTYDALGQLTDFFENGEDNTLQLDAFGRTQIATYDQGGDELEVTYQYDNTPGIGADDGNAPDWTVIDSESTGRIERKFTDNGQLAGWINADGTEISYEYDNGRLATEISYVDATTGNPADRKKVAETTYAYDAQGRIFQTVDVINALTTRYAYDVAGRQVNTRVYEGILSRTDPDPVTPYYQTTNDYTAPTDASVPGPFTTGDSLGRNTTFVYDAGLDRVFDPDNDPTPDDQIGRTTVTQTLDPGESRTTTTFRNPAGLVTRVENPDGSAIGFQYRNSDTLGDAEQFPTAVIDEAGRARNYTYTDDGRLLTASDTADQVVTLVYGDSPGFTPAPDADPTDARRLEQINLPDVDGDPNQNLQRIEYAYDDDDNRVVRTQRPGLGTTETLRFGPDSQPELIRLPTDANGTHYLEMTYDDGGANSTGTRQLLKRRVVHGATYTANDQTISGGTTREHFVYTYANGQLKTITDQIDATQTVYVYEYEEHDAQSPLGPDNPPSTQRLRRVELPNGTAVQYTYDAFGRTQTVTAYADYTGSSPVGQMTEYEYNADGQLHKVWDPNNPKDGLNSKATVYTYDLAGRLSTRLLPNDILTTWAFDTRDRVLSLRHVANNGSGATVASFEYWYTEADPDTLNAGQVANTTSEPRRITYQDDSYTTYDYDEALRLVAERHYDASDVLQDEITYEYDAAGNRTGRSVDGVAELYTRGSNTAYQLESVDGRSFTYDDAGRVTDDGTKELRHNATGQLTSYSPDGGTTETIYRYDGTGQRIGEGGTDYAVAPAAQNLGLELGLRYLTTDASTDTTYVYAGENPIGRYVDDGSGTPTIAYYLEDATDSVRALSDDTGNVAAGDRFDFDAFGNELTNNLSAGDLGYHGAWH
ncbi:MAG: putative Ig domain-containing protein, partial [Planctomycetota bacterium]